MGKFEIEISNDEMKKFEKLSVNSEKMLAEMTDAGADVAIYNVRKNAPSALKSSRMMECLKKTKTYKTPSDDGINTKVGFYGYFTNSRGVKTPAPLVANIFEYGKKGVPKKPFFRKSFNKAQITAAMKKVEDKYLK